METEKPIVWTTISPEIWKPERVEDSIQGRLISKKEDVGVNKSNTYYIDTKKGQYMVWGTTVLDDKMSLIGINEFVRITYKGLVKNAKGQDTKIFKVESGIEVDKNTVVEEVVRKQ